MAMINTLQLAAGKKLILNVIIQDFQGTYQELALIILFFHT
jgi:hypothetical protein